MDTTQLPKRPAAAHCRPLLPAAPRSPSRSATAHSGSAGFWRPWLDSPADAKGQEQPRASPETLDCPGKSGASGKISQYRHPVRLFWPKSKCYDYLYQEAETLLKNFPIQATIFFYEDSDSEDEIEELICENESD